jgi:predicted anti-sigma-YlaC factor YlaD
MMHGEGCRDLLELISEYVDGDLAGELCAELELHLKGCDNCRIVVDTMRKTVFLVHANNEHPILPEDVRKRLYKCLDLEDSIKK